MLHFLVGLLIAVIFMSSDAWSKCSTDTISYTRSSGINIGWSSGGGSSSSESVTTVNIPFLINGEQACYKQSSSLSVKSERVKANEFIEYEITPVRAEFENVPDAKIYQYLNVELNADEAQSKVHMMSFLCSGETPIGAEAFSDSLLKLSVSSGVQAQSRVFIATGMAADNLGLNQKKKTQSKIYDKFMDMYEARQGEAILDINKDNIYIPSVIATADTTTVSSVERRMYSSFFSKTSSSLNGCSKKFLSIMNDLLIENVIKNEQLNNISVKKKKFSDKLILKWTL